MSMSQILNVRNVTLQSIFGSDIRFEIITSCEKLYV